MTDTSIVPISKPERELLELLPAARTRLMAMAARGLERSCAPDPPPQRATPEGIAVTHLRKAPGRAAQVVLDFGRVVVWQRLTSAEARELAVHLVHQADLADHDADGVLL